MPTMAHDMTKLPLVSKSIRQALLKDFSQRQNQRSSLVRRPLSSDLSFKAYFAFTARGWTSLQMWSRCSLQVVQEQFATIASEASAREGQAWA